MRSIKHIIMLKMAISIFLVQIIMLSVSGTVTYIELVNSLESRLQSISQMSLEQITSSEVKRWKEEGIDEEYENTKNSLKTICKNENVESIYLVNLDGNLINHIIDTKIDEGNVVDYGKKEIITDKTLRKLEKFEGISPIVINKHIASVYTKICDNKAVVGILMVNFDMSIIYKKVLDVLIRIFLISTIPVIIIGFTSFGFTKKKIILPIEKLTSIFEKTDVADSTKLLKKIQQLEFEEKHELGILYDSIKEFFEEAYKIQREITHDSLTGLRNKKSYTDRFTSYVDRPGVGIIYADSNRLKYTNDKFGHEVGDELLRRIGVFLKELSDTAKDEKQYRIAAYHVSGDEFILVFTGATKKEIIEVNEKISRKQIPINKKSYATIASGYAYKDDIVLEKHEILKGNESQELKDEERFQLLTETLRETVRRAETNMYKQKERMHNSRDENS